MMSEPLSILLVGGANAGKTHYGGQLLCRLQSDRGRGELRLRMTKMPSDLTPFQEVSDHLAEGRSAPHTPADRYRESVWSVTSQDGRTVSQIIWPDYAGEQVDNIPVLRRVPPEWASRTASAAGWLLMLRLTLTDTPESVLDRPVDQARMRGHQPGAAGSDPAPLPGRVPYGASAEARIVELLQALLFARGASLADRTQRPALVVALSCFDEIPAPDRNPAREGPAGVLRRRLPLVSQFVSANWAAERLAVVGLSALGKTLREDVADEEFVDNGPERQGWCCLPDGSVSSDLTAPLALLMEKMPPR